MAPKPKPSKRDAILDAMLDIVVERGFHDAPMSVLVQRSGASAGVIYHYFASKEEILSSLHERIRVLKLKAFFGDASLAQSPRETFIYGCLSVYTFYRKHRREMRFYEQYQQAGFACAPNSVMEDAHIAAAARSLYSRSSGGALNEWPTAIQEELTLNVITRLAAQPRRLPDALLREVVESMWEMIKARK